MRHHMVQVQIVGAPKFDELWPRRILIVIRPHPAVLLVTGKDEVIFQLTQHKAREAFVVEVLDLQAKVEEARGDQRDRGGKRKA